MIWCIRKTAQSAYLNKIVVVVQSLSSVLHFVTPWTAACQASLSFTVSWSLLKLMSIESVMPANYLVLCHPLLLCLQTFPASESFQWVGSLHLVAKVLQLRPQHISPSNEYSSFRMDWFDLLAVQGISTVFSNSTVGKYLFFDTQPSLWSTPHIHTWLLEKP